MHKNIKKETLRGTIGDDRDFIRLRSQFEFMMVRDMREKGYIPVLDLGPFFSTSYQDGSYEFVLSVYFVYVGRNRAWINDGYSMGKLIPSIIRSTK